MWRTTFLACFVIGSMACGDDGGSSPADASPQDSDGIDAAIDGPSGPTMITISGTVVGRTFAGTTPLEGATVGVYRTTDEATAIGTATSDANGDFTVTISTGGVALTGYVKGTFSGHVDTYLYPAVPVAMDTAMVPLHLMTTTDYDAIYTFAQVSRSANTGLIVVEVTDASTMPVEGVTISSSPTATYKYSDPSTGLPSPTATATAIDGVGYVLDAPPGAITVNASKTGSTFKSNSVKAFANALTTTTIIPQ
jgi:hypothetical protein